ETSSRSRSGSPPLPMDRLKLTLKRLNAASLHTEAVSRCPLQQHIETKPFITSSQRQAKTGVWYIRSADRGPIEIIDHAVIVQVFIAQIARLHFIATCRFCTFGYVLLGIKTVEQIPHGLVYLMPR